MGAWSVINVPAGTAEPSWLGEVTHPAVSGTVGFLSQGSKELKHMENSGLESSMLLEDARSYWVKTEAEGGANCNILYYYLAVDA